MFAEGTIVGTYRVLRKLGEGGMGAVFAGEHTLLGRKAAIKVLLPALSAQEEIVHRFFNEARAVTQIADPGIVQVFDFGYHSDGSAFIVMELLEGEPMDRRLARIGRFAPADALRLMRLICTSLHAAHAKGIVHRDLKPENIYIIPDTAVPGGERPKILDFGIAKLTSDEPGTLKTRTGMMMGTPVYMSPEQCRGAAAVDSRSDIYAIGCVLMTMLTGHPPFEAEGSGELIAAHLREPAPFAASRTPGLPPVLDQILQRCLAKSPDERFQTMIELAQILGHAEHGLYAGAPAYASSPGLLPPTMMPTPGPRMPTPGPRMPTPGPHMPTPGPHMPTPGPHLPTPGPHLPISAGISSPAMARALPTPAGLSSPPMAMLTPAGISSPPMAMPTGGAPMSAVQTTLAGAAGQAAGTPPRRRGMIAGAALATIVVGVIVAISVIRLRAADETPAHDLAAGAAPTSTPPPPPRTTSTANPAATAPGTAATAPGAAAPANPATPTGPTNPAATAANANPTAATGASASANPAAADPGAGSTGNTASAPVAQKATPAALPADSAKADGAKADGAKTDGAKTDGATAAPARPARPRPDRKHAAAGNHAKAAGSDAPTAFDRGD